MKNATSLLLASLLVGYIGYNDREYFADSARYLIHNPAEYVLNSNVSEKEQVYVLENEALGKVTLSAGTEADYGLRHILARHTNKYFVNYKDKNKNTLFEDDITGKEIVIGLKEFYKNCVDVGIYNRASDRNTAYVGFVELKGKPRKCLLVTRKDTKEIVTFYPFNEVSEQELIRDLRPFRFD